MSPLCFSLCLIPEPLTLFIANAQKNWSNLRHLIVCNKSVYTYIIYLHIFYYRVLSTFFFIHMVAGSRSNIFIYIFFLYSYYYECYRRRTFGVYRNCEKLFTVFVCVLLDFFRMLNCTGAEASTGVEECGAFLWFMQIYL